MKRKCWDCERVLPLTSEFFCHHKNKKHGFDYRCKKCKNKAGKKYRDNHLKACRKRTTVWYKNNQVDINNIKKDASCAICGEDDYYCLDFHHVNPRDKKFLINMHNVRKKDFIDELQKCICLCSNCHRKIHYKMRN